MNGIIIIGGDKRQKELNQILLHKGYRCRHIFSVEEMKNVNIHKRDIIVLPVPVSKDGENIYSSDNSFPIKIHDVLSRLTAQNIVFGGGFSRVIGSYLASEGIPCFDYLECDEFMEYNAYLTGIGALKILFENTDEDIQNKKALITGFGRVARYTAKALQSVGCDVRITARNGLQLVQAECCGYKTVVFDEKSSFLYLFDYIFNTVPENIFSSDDINHLKGTYFELASPPFGVSKECFAGKEELYVNAAALPGRYLSKSAAEKLAEITVGYLNLRNGGD